MSAETYEQFRDRQLARCDPSQRWRWADRTLVGNWVSFTMPPIRRGRREWPIPQTLAGVYVLYKFGRLIYIGSSGHSIAYRLGVHVLRFGIEGLTVKVRPMRPDVVKVRRFERKLIERLRPIFNDQWNPLVRS